jgi:hypothetical protein
MEEVDLTAAASALWAKVLFPFPFFPRLVYQAAVQYTTAKAKDTATLGRPSLSFSKSQRMELERNTKREALVKAMENKRLRIETEEAAASTGLMLVGTLFNVPKKRPCRPENPRLWLHFRTKAVHASLTRLSKHLPLPASSLFMIPLRLPLIHPMGVLSAGSSALSAL